MNPVGELLGPDAIQMDVDVPDKAPLLQRIASPLALRLGLADAEVLEGLVTREHLGSRGLGHGVAIPHARMAQCASVGAVFVRTQVPIPCGAPITTHRQSSRPILTLIVQLRSLQLDGDPNEAASLDT